MRPPPVRMMLPKFQTPSLRKCSEYSLFPGSGLRRCQTELFIEADCIAPAVQEAPTRLASAPLRLRLLAALEGRGDTAPERHLVGRPPAFSWCRLLHSSTALDSLRPAQIRHKGNWHSCSRDLSSAFRVSSKSEACRSFADGLA